MFQFLHVLKKIIIFYNKLLSHENSKRNIHVIYICLEKSHVLLTKKSRVLKPCAVNKNAVRY